MKRRITNVPPLCKISTEAGSTYFEIAREDPAPDINVWWDRVRGDQEVLLIRQEAAPGADMADVVMLTHAQAYALLDALNRALELP